jgi:signal recognition particle subunit SRP54
MQQIRKMGGLQKMIGMLPGGERMLQQAGSQADESQLTKVESIIRSMTKEERKKPKKINGQRRKRIAAGSGHTVQDVNQVLKQWDQMNKMMGKMRQMTQVSPKGKKKGSTSRKQMRQMRGMMKNMGIGGMNGLGNMDMDQIAKLGGKKF